MHHSSTRRYHLHASRLVFFGVALLALCLVRIDATALTQTASGEVLAYATNINRNDLLAQTNAARAQNGMGPLTMNSKLNTSSQNKAQHMITYNYWAHVAPDGTQPWYFFEQAGYTYQNAGENLAYGFDTSTGTVNAWMNSPSHKANILGSYVDVGFGIANGDNYQGGPNTVVVAHYGTEQTPAPAPAPAPTPPPAAPTTPSSSTPSAPAPTSQSAAPTTTETTPTTTEPVKETEADAQKQQDTPVAEQSAGAVATSSKHNVSLLQAVTTGSAPMYGIVSMMLLVGSMIGFVFTHRALFHHALVTSEAYVMHHPMVDMAAVAAISLLALSTTVSHI